MGDLPSFQSPLLEDTRTGPLSRMLRRPDAIEKPQPAPRALRAQRPAQARRGTYSCGGSRRVSRTPAAASAGCAVIVTSLPSSARLLAPPSTWGRACRVKAHSASRRLPAFNSDGTLRQSQGPS